jgi:predicted phage-related endonuclease
MNTVELIQGSDEWKAYREQPHVFSASDAPAMMGESKHSTRTKLLANKHLGNADETTPGLQAIYDKGHRAEAAARPIVEQRLGESMFPVTGWIDVDGMMLSASFDGLSMMEDKAWENKLWSASLSAAVEAGELTPHYYWQIEQQLLVSGAERVYFTAATETGDTVEGMWYEAVPGRREQLIAGWKQFAEDLANYKHVEVVEQPKAQVSIELPALFIQAKGQITDSNMVAYGEALKTKLAEVRAIALVTDQDFSDAKAAAAMFRDQRTKLQAAKDAMLSQTMTIGEAARMIDAWSEDLRLTALQLEKDVERKDREKKASIISAGAGEFTAHVAALNARLGGSYGVHFASPNLSEAIKGKRTYTSMASSVSAAVAAAKVDASLVADRIQENRDLLKGDAHDFMFLFPDFPHVCTKPREDFAAMLFQRQTQEEQRLEAERERIRQQEAVKADAQAKAQAAQEARDAAEVRQAGAYAPMGDLKSNVATPEQKQAAVIEHQDEISEFMASREWGKDAGKIRAVLVEFIKWEAERKLRAAA